MLIFFLLYIEVFCGQSIKCALATFPDQHGVLS